MFDFSGHSGSKMEWLENRSLQPTPLCKQSLWITPLVPFPHNQIKCSFKWPIYLLSSYIISGCLLTFGCFGQLLELLNLNLRWKCTSTIHTLHTFCQTFCFRQLSHINYLTEALSKWYSKMSLGHIYCSAFKVARNSFFGARRLSANYALFQESLTSKDTLAT